MNRADFDALEARLEALGALAITLADGDTDVFGEPGRDADAAWSRFAVTALFGADTDPERLVAAVRAHCGDDTKVTVSRLAEREWDDAWRERWQPQRYAGGLCVCPTWCEPPADAHAVVRLDPGRAFGTGTHETTALCLDWLATSATVRGARVVDYGCGSGVLALAAARLGAASVCAVDIDADALEVARANAALNGLDDRVRFGSPEVASAGDVLVANILLGPLLELAPRFATLLAGTGRLALSGLLATQCDTVLAAYGDAFTMEPPVVRGDWALLTGRRR